MNWHVDHYRRLIRSLVGRSVFCVVLGLLMWLGAMLNSSLAAAADLARQPVVDVVVSLGTADNNLVFVPDLLSFQAGKRYKLTLINPSSQKHYFTAKDFADNTWTQKVDAGKVEIKGAVHELELKPGATADWFFVPMKAGTYSLHCSIPGHREAGMVGMLTIAAN